MSISIRTTILLHDSFSLEQKGWSFVDTNLQQSEGLVPREWACTMVEILEGCSGFIFSEDLWRHFLWVLHCFDVFWTISDIVFKVNILPTCDFLFIYLKHGYKVLESDPFRFRGSTDQIWILKWLVLQNRRGLIQQFLTGAALLNKHELMVQRSLINKNSKM